MDPDLIIVIILLVLSGFFSASETALMTVTPAKVRTLVEAKKPGSKYLAKLKKAHHKTLITILVGNNFVNIMASALTTVMITEYFASAAVGISTGVLTAVILVFGEVVPKSLATTYAKRLALTVAPVLFYFGLILTPIIWLLDGLVKILLKLLGTKKQKQVTDEELIAMAVIGEEEGSIDEHERELIENILEFNDIHVEEIMTPRVHINAMPEDHDLGKASEFVLHHTHSRLPIYRGTLDNIVGILSLKDLVKALHKDEKDTMTLRKMKLHNPLKVKADTPIHTLFYQFKSKRTHFAIVQDTAEKTIGIITMEDLLEEIVGDIEDEHDEGAELIRNLDDGLYELSGHVQLDQLEELTDLKFEHPSYKTVSFLITEQLGHLPKKGSTVTISNDKNNWEFRVTQIMRNAILKIELRKL